MYIINQQIGMSKYHPEKDIRCILRLVHVLQKLNLSPPEDIIDEHGSLNENWNVRIFLIRNQYGKYRI